MPKCTDCEYLGKLEGNRGSGEGLYECERVPGGQVPKFLVEKDMKCLKYAKKGTVKDKVSKWWRV